MHHTDDGAVANQSPIHRTDASEYRQTSQRFIFLLQRLWPQKPDILVASTAETRPDALKTRKSPRGPNGIPIFTGYRGPDRLVSPEP
jgi:hypothetical protein